VRWPVAQLGDLAEVQLGKMLSPKAKTGAGGAPYLRNVNVQWGRIDLSDLFTMDFGREERQKFELRRGDVLVCEGGEPGRCAIVDQDLDGVFFQKALMRVRVRDSVLDPRFLLRFMQRAAGRGLFVDGGNQATIAHFPAVRLKAVELPLPPLPEQRRIADILDKADAIRRKRKETIALNEELVRSAFLDMFGDPVGNPRGWSIATLGSVAASIDYGVTASANVEPVGPKFLRITDIQQNRVDWDSVPYCACDKGSADAARLETGDIVFARTGATTGKSFLIGSCPPGAVFASYLIRVRPGRGVDSGYLAEFFQSTGYWSQIRGMAEGAAQPGVNASKLGALRIPLPPLSEQMKFEGVASRVRAIARAGEQAALESDTLFSSLLDRAFRGELTS
jgi:type I restriction enzyme S subunit